MNRTAGVVQATGAEGYVLAIDQGTTSSTVMIFALSDWAVVARASVPFQQHYPRPSWVEHDLEDVWGSVGEACRQACLRGAWADKSFAPERIRCIGITNQRETLCVMERESGRPVMPAIVWQCKRSIGLCDELKGLGVEKELREKTGLPLDPYFSGTKLLWLLRHEPEVARGLGAGSLCVGTIDSYLVLRLTAAKAFVTEPSNASRTLWFALKGAQWDWDEELLRLFEVPSVGVLPRVKDSHACFGTTQGLDFLPNGIPITGILGDQQAAVLGQQCLQPLQAKCTYGTGAFLLIHTGERCVLSQHGLLSTVGWQVQGRRRYLLEGSSFIAGAGVDYLKDQWQFFDRVQHTSEMAQRCHASPGVIFVPAFSGLGAPHWCPQATASLFGLTRDTPKEVIVRAMLEGVAFSVADLVRAGEKDIQQRLAGMRVDGGMSKNDVVMQFQSDILDLVLERPQEVEVTALGVAVMAAYGVGAITSLELAGKVTSVQRFHPEIPAQERHSHLQAWSSALTAVQTFSSQNRTPSSSA